jgi:energy-coupling factor transporter ATP-binding protein EcfA2
MRLRHLSIKNFRGVRELDWSLDANFAVLIGPGDSGKSTVLDAVALAASPRWNPLFTDADFFGGDPKTPVLIEATFVGLPATLTREDLFGHLLRGVGTDGLLHPEPGPQHDVALTVRLKIDSALEPTWEIVRAPDSEGIRITATSRAQFGVFQLSDEGSQHLRWGRASALSRLGETGEIGPALVDAHRAARAAVFALPPPGLSAGADAAGKAIKRIGGASLTDPRPGLDPAAGQRAASLVLHDGDVPASGLGLGSRRLAGIAFELEAADEQSIALIDEVEIGLEPHRLRHLIRRLKQREPGGQVILSTHSPVVVEEVAVTDLYLVRRDSAKTRIRQVPAAIEGLGSAEPQATTRGGAAAMLARRVVVCEGPTEVGLCRALFHDWDAAESVPAALAGAVSRDGRGSEAPTKAECLAELGYEVALLVDDDLSARKDQRAYAKAVSAAIARGAVRLTWSSGMATEDQIARSLPASAVQDLLVLAVELNESDDPEVSVRAAVAARLDWNGDLEGLDPVDWCRQTGSTGPEVRAAIGVAAREKRWFKSQSRGQRLGELVAAALPALSDSDPLKQTTSGLRRFVYGHPEAHDRSGEPRA